MKPKIFHIKEFVFESSINFLINYTFKDANKFLIKKGMLPIENEFEFSNALSFKRLEKETCYFAIWIKNLEWTLKSQSLLVHEINHIIFMIMAEIGIEIHSPEIDGNEPFCYLSQYYFYRAAVEIGNFYIEKEYIREKENET